MSGRKKCDKYAIIFTCKLCYKDKLGQTYMYAYWVEGKNVILHIFMYNVMSDFSGARWVSEGRVKYNDGEEQIVQLHKEPKENIVFMDN